MAQPAIELAGLLVAENPARVFPMVFGSCFFYGPHASRGEGAWPHSDHQQTDYPGFAGWQGNREGKRSKARLAGEQTAIKYLEISMH